MESKIQSLKDYLYKNKAVEKRHYRSICESFGLPYMPNVFAKVYHQKVLDLAATEPFYIFSTIQNSNFMNNLETIYTMFNSALDHYDKAINEVNRFAAEKIRIIILDKNNYSGENKKNQKKKVQLNY